jgi:hypothetical protein
MDGEIRQQKIESYGRAYEQLTAALQGFPREMWTFKPSDGWSIHEIVVHIADSEANSYARCRKCMAEPGSTIMAYDENQWAKTLRYEEQSTDDALELFKCLRRSTYKLIKNLPESTWSHTIEHPENGTMTLNDWLDTYAAHIPDHVRQMTAAYNEWKKSKD